MMNTASNWFPIISVLLGGGGIVYTIVVHILNRAKNKQEVRSAAADADIKSEQFYKDRYEILLEEKKSIEAFWQTRYDNLEAQFQKERQQNNDMVTNFRTQLNNIRTEYEEQRDIERKRYDNLMNEFQEFKEDSMKKETNYIQRIRDMETQLMGAIKK